MQHEPHPVVSRREGLWAAVLTAVFGLWLLVWALVVPAFQAPDEAAHFDAAVHVATEQTWPAPGTLHVSAAVRAATLEQADGDASTWSTMSELLAAHPGPSTTVNQMTQHPPTAYVADALVLRVLHYGSLRWDHALVALRVFDSLLVMPVVLLAWAAVRRVTRSPRAALVGALAVFAVPQLAAIGSSVTNDAPTILLGAVVVWLATRMLTGDLRRRTLVGIGVAVGLLAWAKGTGLPAVPFVALVTVSGSLPLARRVLRTVGVLAVAAGVGAWWWLRNLLLFHTLQPDGYAAIRPDRPFPAGQHASPLHFLDVSWGTLARTFWGSPGQRAQVSTGDLFTAVLTIVTLVVVIGWAFRRGRTWRTAWCLAAFPALLLLAQTTSSAAAYLDTTEVAGTQGRYLFPAVLCLVVLSALAWRRLPLPPRARVLLPGVLAVALPTIGLTGLVIAAGWFWNAARALPTAASIARYDALGPVPFPVVVVVAVFAGAGLTAGVLRAARPRHRSTLSGVSPATP